MAIRMAVLLTPARHVASGFSKAWGATAGYAQTAANVMRMRGQTAWQNGCSRCRTVISSLALPVSYGLTLKAFGNSLKYTKTAL